LKSRELPIEFFINDYSLSKEARHAIDQTLDWDIWLENNKDYLQRKLPKFETPRYLVIIGRGNELDDNAKARLRAHNRNWSRGKLLTYDDVLKRFREVIRTLKNACP
jgi:hypothetical protein